MSYRLRVARIDVEIETDSPEEIARLLVAIGDAFAGPIAAPTRPVRISRNGSRRAVKTNERTNERTSKARANGSSATEPP